MRKFLCSVICLLATLVCQANVSVDSTTALQRLGNGPFVISLQQGGYLMDCRHLIH